MSHSPQETQSETEHVEEHVPKENLIVLFFFCCIVVSIISREINKRFSKIPYTPLLIAFGFLIGTH